MDLRGKLKSVLPTKEGTKKALKTAGTFMSKNAPAIAGGIAVVTMLGAVVTAVTGTKKCIAEMDALYASKAAECGDPEHAEPVVTKKEKAIVYLKCYWLTALLAVASGTFTVLSVTSANKQIKGLAVLCAAAENALDRQTVSIEELVGPKKANEITMNANKKLLEDQAPALDDSLIERSSLGGDTLFYDETCRRYFYGDPMEIKNAVNELNADLLDTGFVSLNDLYDKIGIYGVKWGSSLGWRSDGLGDRLVRVSIEYDPNVNKRPTAILTIRSEPQVEY